MTALVCIARGTLPEILDGKTTADVTVKDRVRAIELLLERGFGKAPALLEVYGNVTHRPSDATIEELYEFIAIKRAKFAELQAAEAQVVDSEGQVVDELTGEGACAPRSVASPTRGRGRGRRGPPGTVPPDRCAGALVQTSRLPCTGRR